MTEVVKVVNGYAITRTKGTRGFYEVTLWVSPKGKARGYRTFKTIKAAAEYIENIPAGKEIRA